VSRLSEGEKKKREILSQISRDAYLLKLNCINHLEFERASEARHIQKMADEGLQKLAVTESMRVTESRLKMPYNSVSPVEEQTPPVQEQPPESEEQYRVGNVDLELFKTSDNKIAINLVFLNTGEIRQKRVSWEWLLKRLFMYSLKTWTKRNIDPEDIVLHNVVLGN